MTTDANTDTGPLVRTFVSLAITLAFVAALLFVPAGTLGWTRGWVFLGVVAVLMIASTLYVWRLNPELFTVRRRIQKGSKSWDLLLGPFTVVAFAAIVPLAALDAGRRRDTVMPVAVEGVGYALLVLGFALLGWAQAANRHFELTVRVQTDRGHKVVETGPYALVRHPGYIGAIAAAAGMALSLGSLWALVPVAALAVVLAFRTLGEEATLRAELPGYDEYTRRVKYRWVPRIW